MNTEFGLKELYDVVIKTTSNIEINGKTLDEGETIVAFDKIQISNFQEVKKITTANGGFDNRAHIWWETSKSVNLVLSQGIFSKQHFAMMINAKLFNIQSGKPIYINRRQSDDIEWISANVIKLKKEPAKLLFIYDKDTGTKLNWTYLGNNQVQIENPTTNIIVDYMFKYNNQYQYISIGEELTYGYFTLEGKTRVKDDITGKVKTGIFMIPKLKLVSDLSMKLGENAYPVLGTVDAVACPIGSKGNTTVMEIIFLDEDIDADII